MIDPGSASDWLRQQGLQSPHIEPLTGDVSPRRYFRVRIREGETFILAGYPSSLGATYGRFVETTALMETAGISVPRILVLDENLQWMLLQDLGDKTLYDEPRSWSELEGFFRTAIEDLEKVRQIPATKVETLNPHLNSAALWKELEQTFDTVLVPWEMVSDRGLRRQLQDTLEAFCLQIGTDALVPCHRDFMARNLVPQGESSKTLDRGAAKRLAVLDHQDLRLGPSRYDLASLLNDSLFPPREIEDRLLDQALGSQEEVAVYRRAAVQRTLKAVGTFGSFARRGFRRHLPLIPPTLRRSLDQLERLPEGRELAEGLRRSWQRGLNGSLLDSQ